MSRTRLGLGPAKRVVPSTTNDQPPLAGQAVKPATRLEQRCCLACANETPTQYETQTETQTEGNRQMLWLSVEKANHLSPLLPRPSPSSYGRDAAATAAVRSAQNEAP